MRTRGVEPPPPLELLDRDIRGRSNMNIRLARVKEGNSIEVGKKIAKEELSFTLRRTAQI